MNINKFKVIDNIPYYKDKKLKTYKNTQGYIYVTIEKKQYRLHRLIAIKYIPNPNNYKIVGHKDDIKTNNSVSNLYWTTNTKNIQKAFKSNIGMRKMHFGKQKVKAVKENLVINFQSVRQASRILKRDSSAITRCCQGEWNKCNGFKLYYV